MTDLQLVPAMIHAKDPVLKRNSIGQTFLIATSHFSTIKMDLATFSVALELKWMPHTVHARTELIG